MRKDKRAVKEESW